MPRRKKRPPAPAPAPSPEPKPRARPHTNTLESFCLHLSRTGSITYAAARAGLDRRRLYRLKAEDEEFAAQWDEALQLGVERLQDDAMRRALDGVERPVWRGGKRVGSIRQHDNRLMQFLLRAHRPETYGDKSRAGTSPLPFDLAKRLAASAPRLEAHRREEEARRNEKPEEPPHDKRRRP